MEQLDQFLDINMLMKELELVFRLVLAGLCGGVVGFERERKQKTAGLRTHIIVAVSSALMIVMSKYGFADVLGVYVRLDPSRIAAGAVTAIGFLGSGVIFARNNRISGLTTSAGIWATVGVGMAIGSGMYVIGVCAALIILFVESVMGRRYKISHVVQELYQVQVEYQKAEEDTTDFAALVKTQLEERYSCKILRHRIRRKGEGIRLELLAKTLKGSELVHLSELMEQYPQITKITF